MGMTEGLLKSLLQSTSEGETTGTGPPPSWARAGTGLTVLGHFSRLTPEMVIHSQSLHGPNSTVVESVAYCDTLRDKIPTA